MSISPADREVLRAFKMSIDDLCGGRASFAERPDELQLGKHPEAILALGATSPTSAFGANS